MLRMTFSYVAENKSSMNCFVNMIYLNKNEGVKVVDGSHAVLHFILGHFYEGTILFFIQHGIDTVPCHPWVILQKTYVATYGFIVVSLWLVHELTDENNLPILSLPWSVQVWSCPWGPWSASCPAGPLALWTGWWCQVPDIHHSETTWKITPGL